MTQSWEQMNVKRRSVLLLGLTGASALALGRHDRARAAEAAHGPGDSMVAAARALIGSLDDGQLRRAVIETQAPQDIITANNRDVALREPKGLPAAAMTEPLRGKRTP